MYNSEAEVDSSLSFQKSSEAIRIARHALECVDSVSLFTDVVRDPQIEAFVDILHAIAHEGSVTNSLRYRFFGLIADAVVNDPPLLARVSSQALSAFESLLVERTLLSDNPFTRIAERAAGTLPAGLVNLASHDLRCLQALLEAAAKLAGLIDPDGVLAGLVSSQLPNKAKDLLAEERLAAATKLAAAADWGACVSLLAEYISRVGAGLIGKFAAFRWSDGLEAGRTSPSAPDFGTSPGIVPIAEPDLVDLGDLIEFEEERAVVIRNTEKFIRGLPAQNVLLYGDRGTGKSATVKAMLHTFARSGLRMIEIPRQSLRAIQTVISIVRERHRPFILFIDDLSFEEGDTAYKDLKAVLEGTLEGRPRNLLVYATSNRRHLIQQHFADRRVTFGDDGEINPQDTVQEKLSLADRFGITVIFPTPDQSKYLRIVSGIAKRRGIDLPQEVLHQKALRWAAWNNGRSARTAQRFVDYLIGELDAGNGPEDAANQAAAGIRHSQ